MPHAPIMPRTWWLVLGLAMAAPPVIAQTPGAPRSIPEGLNFANGLYRSRQYDLAAEEYEKFLRSGQAPSEADAADAWFGLGNARLFLGKYKEARQAFEEFVRVAPEHPNASAGRYRIGEAAYVLGDLPAARRYLESYVASAGGDARYRQAAWSHLGDVDFRLGDLPAARKAYDNALLGNPKGSLASRARLGLGRVLASQSDNDEALRVFRDLAASGGPEWSDKAWLEVARIDATLGRWADAVEALESLEKANPRSPSLAEARIDRAEALARLDRGEEAETILRSIADDPAQPLAARAADALGSSELARGKADQALATFDRAGTRLASSPSASTLRYHAAEAALALGRLEDARSRFLKLVEDDPQGPLADDSLLRAAAITLDAKDPATARRLAAAFASRFPDSPLRDDARLVDARASLALGLPKEAIRTLEASTGPDKAPSAASQASSYYLGLAYQKDGQAEKAAEVFDNLAKARATPVSADAQFMLGQVHFEAARYAQAVEALDRYRLDKPKGEVVDHALAMIAQSQWALGKPDDAIRTLTTLSTAFPDRPLVAITAIRMGEAAMAARQYDRSADLLRIAADRDDSTFRARARSGQGWALLRANKPIEAAEAFGLVLKATPDDPLAPEAALARSKALEDAKQPEAALIAYSQAFEKYPKSPQAGPAALAMARLQVESKKPDDAARSYALVVKDYPEAAGEPLDVLLSEWGWALIDAGKPAEADATFARLVKEFPESPRAADGRHNLAVSAFAARDFDRVLDLLKPLVAEGSDARPQLVRSALNLYGRAQAERADWPGASATFRRLIAEDSEGPFRREARFWKAEVAFKSGDARGAELEFAALSAEPPQDTDFRGLAATARARRAQCLAQLGRWDETIAAADAFKGTDPDDTLAPEVEYARGRACQGLARFDEARASFDRVIAARKGSELAARAQLMRGETYFHQRQYKEALREYYRVIIQYNAPEWQAVALLEAGKVHEKLDQWREAAESYEKLRAQFPGDRNADEAGKRLEAARAKIARPAAPDDSPP